MAGPPVVDSDSGCPRVWPNLAQSRVADVAGDWAKAQKAHFSDGGVFDQIYQPARK